MSITDKARQNFVIMIVLTIILFLGSLCTSEALAVLQEGPNSRIVGGWNATIRGSPFIAAINVQTSNSRHFCGGSLLDQQWVLTAAQCVDGATLFTINFGSEFLEAEDSNRVTVATSTYFMHPEYNPNTLENDIALIELRMPITYTDYIQPIDYIAEVTLGYTIHVLGWGQIGDHDSSLSSRLQLAYLVPLTNDDCKTTYGSQIKDTMVCMAADYNEGICHGDTGGPLVEKFNSGLSGHVGVASFISGNGCNSPDPSGFTRTYPYLDWIRETTGLDID